MKEDIFEVRNYDLFFSRRIIFSEGYFSKIISYIHFILIKKIHNKYFFFGSFFLFYTKQFFLFFILFFHSIFFIYFHFYYLLQIIINSVESIEFIWFHFTKSRHGSSDPPVMWMAIIGHHKLKLVLRTGLTNGRVDCGHRNWQIIIFTY